VTDNLALNQYQHLADDVIDASSNIRNGARFIRDRTLLITSLARSPSLIIRSTAARASAQFGQDD